MPGVKTLTLTILSCCCPKNKEKGRYRCLLSSWDDTTRAIDPLVQKEVRQL